MDDIYIGKIVSTHGIKGEVKIISDFEYKDKVFVVGNKLIIDGDEYNIRSYRHHKNFEMVTLNEYNDINQVLFLLRKKVYFRKSDLILSDDEILDSELITYKVLTNTEEEGIIKEIFYGGPNNKIIRIYTDREYLIPYNLVKIDKENKIVHVEIMEGM